MSSSGDESDEDLQMAKSLRRPQRIRETSEGSVVPTEHFDILPSARSSPGNEVNGLLNAIYIYSLLKLPVSHSHTSSVSMPTTPRLGDSTIQALQKKIK